MTSDPASSVSGETPRRRKSQGNALRARECARWSEGHKREVKDQNDKLTYLHPTPDTQPPPYHLHPTPHTLEIPETAKLIGLKSPKGTGKTHLIEQIVEQATQEGKWVLLLTHRIQLGEALCQRVGLPYLTEIVT